MIHVAPPYPLRTLARLDGEPEQTEPPPSVVSGAEPFLIVGAMAGG